MKHFLFREHKKMSMEMMDLKNKMKDVTSMKVTREIQQVSLPLSGFDINSKLYFMISSDLIYLGSILVETHVDE